MKDYISREEANEACREAVRRCPNSFYNGIEAARDAIRKLPAADVRPVVRGEWLPIIEGNEYGETYQTGCYCSECNEVLQHEPNFCPNCGADMRGEQVELVEMTGELASKPRWIPVSERLPEDRQSVLVHRDDGGIFIFEYFTTSPTDECWIDDHLNVYSAYCVTHWQPLPEPPKEENYG